MRHTKPLICLLGLILLVGQAPLRAQSGSGYLQSLIDFRDALIALCDRAVELVNASIERQDVIARAYGDTAVDTGDTTGGITHIDTIEYDTTASMVLAANGPKFTAPIAGYYDTSLAATISFPKNSIPVPMRWSYQCALRKNGSLLLDRRSIASNNQGSTGAQTIQVNGVIYLEVGDTLETWEEFDDFDNIGMTRRAHSHFEVALRK